MNFIEAAKLSDHVRRKGLAKHCGSDGKGWIDAKFAFNMGKDAISYFMPTNPGTPLLTWEDLMADDWDAKEETVEVTKNKFFQALSAAMKAAGENSRHVIYDGNIRSNICLRKLQEELGFK